MSEENKPLATAAFLAMIVHTKCVEGLFNSSQVDQLAAILADVRHRAQASA